jgi:alpha/beta superfamily hydrolase
MILSITCLERQPLTDLFVDGPAGRLETCYSEAESAIGISAVLCHPHPQMGGTMNDMVLDALEPALLASGINSLRFNFRGVGGSEGAYSDGVGEIEDVVAAATWVRESSAGERLFLAGYSFGGAVALSAQELVAPESMILVAPAVGMFGQQQAPTVPTLVILAENDQFVNADSTKDWFGDTDAQVELISGTDHFFSGYHDQITRIVREFLTSTFNE